MKEKKLTPAEKKKREEIAKAIEKDNPNMPMAKKMAIATATAKRVAEYGGPPISRKKYLKQKPMDKELEEKMAKDKDQKEGAMSRLATQDAERKRLGPNKVKGSGLDTFKPRTMYSPSGTKQVAHSRIDAIRLKKQGYSSQNPREAVSPAQQAAIAISKKERGEKPKNECASEDDFKPHMMYDPKTGKGVMAKKYADHVKYDKMGYTHEKPDVKESRAYRDAMRGMKSRSATRGMATTKKDKDTEASDDDRKAASKNIIMQLRKAADLPTGAEVEFERGKGKVSRAQAQGALARFNALAKPRDKEAFQRSIRSLSDIKKILGR